MMVGNSLVKPVTIRTHYGDFKTISKTINTKVNVSENKHSHKIPENKIPE